MGKGNHLKGVDQSSTDRRKIGNKWKLENIIDRNQNK